MDSNKFWKFTARRSCCPNRRHGWAGGLLQRRRLKALLKKLAALKAEGCDHEHPRTHPEQVKLLEQMEDPDAPNP